MSGTIAVARWTPERVTLVATRETWEALLAAWRKTGYQRAHLQVFEAAYSRARTGTTIPVVLSPDTAAVVQEMRGGQ